MFLKKYIDIEFVNTSFVSTQQDDTRESFNTWSASFELERDVSILFPYINAMLDDALYYNNPEHIRFQFKGYRCFLYPDIVAAHFFEKKSEAKSFIDGLFQYLNDIYNQKDDIKPNYDQIRPIPITDILKILPRTNCRECGYTTCMSFAADLIKGRTIAHKCPGIGSPISVNTEYPVLDKKGRMVESVFLQMGVSQLAGKNQSIAKGSPKNVSNEFGLTEREIEVLELMSQGNTNNEIAGLLFISPHTVKSHMINIFNKMSVNDRTQASVIAAKNGVI